jgi:hypothetical protein
LSTLCKPFDGSFNLLDKKIEQLKVYHFLKMPTDSLTQLIKEALTEGNLLNFFDNHKEMPPIDINDDFYQRVFQCLVNLPVTDRTCIAYSFVCAKLKENQYLDGEHFLCAYAKATNTPPVLYGCIYVLRKCKIDALKRDDSTSTIADILTPSMVLLHQDEDLMAKMRIISGLEPKKVLSEHHSLMRYLSISYSSKRFDFYMLSDHLSYDNCTAVSNCFLKKSNHDEMLKSVKARLDHLKTSAPRYYEYINARYKISMISLINAKSFNKFNNEFIDCYISIVYPDKVDANLTTKTLLMHPKEVQNYFLGYPIHMGVPSQAMYEKLLDEFSTDVETFYQKQVAHNQQRLNAIVQNPYYASFGENSIIQRNTENTLFEKFEEYSPSDVYPYVNGNNLYFFTREEFSTLIEKKKNFLTGEELPPHIQDYLLLMNKFFSFYPACKPLKQYYESLSKGENIVPVKDSLSTDEMANNLADLLINAVSGGGLSVAGFSL